MNTPTAHRRHTTPHTCGLPILLPFKGTPFVYAIFVMSMLLLERTSAKKILCRPAPIENDGVSHLLLLRLIFHRPTMETGEEILVVWNGEESNAVISIGNPILSSEYIFYDKVKENSVYLLSVSCIFFIKRWQSDLHLKKMT